MRTVDHNVEAEARLLRALDRAHWVAVEREMERDDQMDVLASDLWCQTLAAEGT